MVLTMVLHPTGGDIAHIMKIHDMAIIAHSLAIFSLPFMAYGFYGLAIYLQNDSKISFLAYAFILFGLIAAMIAASINGLVLPMFVERYFSEFEQNQNILKPIIRYGFFLNESMDYILLAGNLIAILIWSVLIIQGDKFLKWLGYYGIVLFIISLFGAIIGFDFIHLFGFRIIVFSIVGWIILAGWMMNKLSRQ
jgi:hypothetical protein